MRLDPEHSISAVEAPSADEGAPLEAHSFVIAPHPNEISQKVFAAAGVTLTLNNCLYEQNWPEKRPRPQNCS